MAKFSDQLNKLFEDLGIKDDDPLLIDDEDDKLDKNLGQDEEASITSYHLDDIDSPGTTPPRTRRRLKQRKINAYRCNAIAAAKTVYSKNKHENATRCTSLPADSDSRDTKFSYKKSWREKNLPTSSLLSSDQSCDVMLDDLPNKMNGLLPDKDGSKHESLPPSLAVKVCPRRRYRSIVSKITEKLSMDVKETSELLSDRVSFHFWVTSCLLSSNASQDTSSFSYKPQRSEEEVQVHQEINEIIWLEIQAWHAGQHRHQYDSLLIEKRRSIEDVYQEVMAFNLNSNGISNSSVDQEITGNSEMFWSGRGNSSCRGCLSVWCEVCRQKETEALEAVFTILEKVDYAYSLFPSSRKLLLYCPEFAKQEFVDKHLALCLWFNLMTRLRFVIHLLGLRLGYSRKDFVPWPTFPAAKLHEPRSPSQSESSKDSGRYSSASQETKKSLSGTSSPLVLSASANSKAEKCKKPLKTVAFQVEIEDSSSSSYSSSNPSQSTDSNESELTSNEYGNSGGSQTMPFGCKSLGHLSPPVPIYALRRCSSDIFLEANPYRKYVEKLLRNKGMKKTLEKFADIIRDVMSRAMNVIEMSQSRFRDKDFMCKVESDGKLVPPPLTAFREELGCNGHWTKKFSSYGLPGIHTLCLFLASVPLHMMMECLKIRLEQEPHEPSNMSIKQLMTEYKEGIKFAVIVRLKFVQWCKTLVSDLPPPLAFNLETRKSHAIQELDCNIKKMLQVYLKWLDQLILMMHSETQVAGLQRDFLQDEWCFVRSTCCHVAECESLSSIQFCKIASRLLGSVRDFLDTGFDENFQTPTTFDASYDLDETEDSERHFAGIDWTAPAPTSANRRNLVLRCRFLQKFIDEARERSLRAIALAKMLKMDLEIAFEAHLTTICTEGLFGALAASQHILVEGHKIKHLAIFVPEFMKDIEDIQSTLLMQAEGSSDKYLILLNLETVSNFSWQGQTSTLSLNDECAAAVSGIQVNGLLVLVRDGSQVQPVRSRISDLLKDILIFEKGLVNVWPQVTQSLMDLKTEALQLCECVEKMIRMMQDLLNINQFLEMNYDEFRSLSHLARDTLQHGFSYGFEYHREVWRLVSGHQRVELASLLIKFGRLWMKFVSSHYSRGKGCRPRWATAGFEFLLFVCDPHNTSLVSDLEFAVFSREVEECYSYVVGATSAVSGCVPPAFPYLSDTRNESQPSTTTASRNIDSPDVSDNRSSPLGRYKKDFPLSDLQKATDKDTQNYSAVMTPMDTVREAIELLEEEIEDRRLREGTIGRVSIHRRDTIELQQHSVPFSWHRGFKIGSGRFGKVYSAINNNSGEFMAMKVVPLQPNDQLSIGRTVRELDTFERISHPHLVKYYGVEVHSDEMLIFMEYCDEGTLEALAATAEGLPEEIVRKYSRQLLSAVQALHEHGIVHRDIKGANIFLAMEANILKLGDFGCAVRLCGPQTEVNELSGIVGTHAFMAPEIFRSNEGHGRSADVWSVGCVVIEMLTGKRPWPQYDSSVQIMFQVGSGGSPEIPDWLSDEGVSFLSMCFIHCPKERTTAAKLLDHAFVKVDDGEVLNSLPLFSLNCFSKAQKVMP